MKKAFMMTGLDMVIFRLLNGLKKSGERLQHADVFPFVDNNQCVNTAALRFLRPSPRVIQKLPFDIIECSLLILNQ